MSKEVDQRIVEMEFDNAQFEKGVASTIASLKNLEKSMEFKASNSGFANIQKAIDSISSSSAIGELSIFEKALEKVRDVAGGVFGHIEGLISKVSKGISIASAVANTGLAALSIHGGWNRATNLNQAQFKLEGQGVDWESIFPAVDKAVTGTAYSLDSAAKAAASFAASNVKLGDTMSESSPMYRALRATAGLAAVSGRDFDSVANIMGAVAGQGRLMGMQLQQFSLSGLNVAATMAKQWGIAEAEVRDMVSKGKIDFETFSNAMYEAFGPQAEKANETFEGSLSNIRSALGRITADVFQAFQKNVVPILNAFRENVNSVAKAMSPLFKSTYSVLKNTEKGLEVVTTAANPLFELMKKIFDEVAAAMNAWNRSDGPSRLNELFLTLQEILVGVFTEIEKGAWRFTYAIILIGAAFRDFVKMVINYTKPIVDAFGEVFQGSFERFANDFFDGMIKVNSVMNKMIKPSKSLNNILKTLATVVFSVLKAAGSAVYEFLNGAIKGLLDGISGAYDILDGFFSGIYDAMQATNKSIGKNDGILGYIKSITESIPVLGPVIDFLSSIPKTISAFFDSMRGDKGAFKNFLGSINDSGGKFVEIGSSIGKVFETLGGKLKEFGEFVKNSAADTFTKMLEDMGKVWTVVEPGLEKIRDYLGEKISWAIGEFQKAWENAGPSFEAFREAIGDRLVAAGETLKKAWDFISPVFDGIGKFVSGAWETIKNAFIKADFNADPIIKFFGGVGDSISTFIDSIGEKGINFDTIGEFLSNIGTNFSDLWNDYLPKFQSFTSDIGTAIYDNLEGPLKDLADWVINIKNPLEDLSNNFNTNMKPIFDFFGSIKIPFLSVGDSQGSEDALSTAAQALGGASEGASEIFDNMVSLETIATAIAKPAETVKNFLSGSIKGAFESLNSFLNDPNVTQVFDKLITLGINAGLMAGLYEAIRMFDGVASLLKSMDKIGKELSNVVSGLGEIVDAQKALIKMNTLLTVALAALAIAGAIVLVATVDPDRLEDSFNTVARCLALLLGFVALVSLETKHITFDPGKLAGLGTIFASFAVVIGAIGGIIYLLGHELTEEQLDRGTTVTFRMMLFFIGFYAVMGYLEENRSGFASIGNDMIKVVAALGLLSYVIHMLGEMKSDVALIGILRLTFVMVMMGTMVAALKLIVAQGGGFEKDLKELSIGLLILAASMVILSQIPIDKALTGAIGLALVFSVLLGATYILKKGKMSFALMEASTGIILIAVAVGILASALALLVFAAGGNWATVLASCAGLTLVMVALAGLSSIVSKSGSGLMAAVPGLIAMAVALAGVMVLVMVLSQIKWPMLLENIVKFIIVVAVLAGAIALLGAAGEFGAAGLLAITSFIFGVAVAIGVVALALIGIVAAMALFSSVFRQFAQAWVDGWAILNNSASEVEQNVAATTKAFAGGTADGFRDAAPQIGDSIIATLKAIAERLPEAGEAFAHGAFGLVVKFITGIANAVDEYGPQLVEAVGKLLTSLGSGIANFFGSQLDGIRRQFESLENSFKSEEQIMAEHTNSMWEAARILKMKVAEASTMSKEEGAASIAEFLNGIEEHYGVRIEELKSFINANQEELGGESAIKAIDAYNQKLNEAEAPELVKSDPEKEKATAETAGFNVVDAITSIIGEKVGETDLSSIMDGNGFFDSEKLKELASSKGLDVATMLNGSIGEGIDTQAILDQVSTEGLDIESSDGIKRFQELLGEAGEGGGEAMGEGIETGFTEHLAATDVSALALKEGIDTDTLNKNMTEAGKVAAGAFASGFQDNMKIDGTDKVNDALDKLKQNGRFKSVAKSNAESAVEGFEEGLKNFAAKAADAAKDASEALGGQNHHDKAVTVGEEMVNGVIVGLGNNSGPLADTAASIITNAISAMQVAGLIRSPSRKTMWIADMMGEGLIRGLKSITPLAEKESREVMSRSLSVMMAEASYLTDLIDQMDDSPVIRPVLDLTDFTAGASQMSRLMPSAVNSTIGFASKMMDTSASRNQNGTTSHVYNISLNYQAGDDANKMVRDLTFALQSKSLLEG